MPFCDVVGWKVANSRPIETTIISIKIKAVEAHAVVDIAEAETDFLGSVHEMVHAKDPLYSYTARFPLANYIIGHACEVGNRRLPCTHDRAFP